MPNNCLGGLIQLTPSLADTAGKTMPSFGHHHLFPSIVVERGCLAADCGESHQWHPNPQRMFRGDFRIVSLSPPSTRTVHRPESLCEHENRANRSKYQPGNQCHCGHKNNRRRPCNRVPSPQHRARSFPYPPARLMGRRCCAF